MIGLEHHPPPEEQRTQLSSLELPLESEGMAVGSLSVACGISTLVSGSGQFHFSSEEHGGANVTFPDPNGPYPESLKMMTPVIVPLDIL